VRLELSALRCRCSRISRARRITRRYGRPSPSLPLPFFFLSISPPSLSLSLFPSARRVSFNSRPFSRELRRTYRKTAYRELQSLIRQKPLRAVNAATERYAYFMAHVGVHRFVCELTLHRQLRSRPESARSLLSMSPRRRASGTIKHACQRRGFRSREERRV